MCVVSLCSCVFVLFMLSSVGKVFLFCVWFLLVVLFSCLELVLILRMLLWIWKVRLSVLVKLFSWVSCGLWVWLYSVFMCIVVWISVLVFSVCMWVSVVSVCCWLVVLMFSVWLLYMLEVLDVWVSVCR